MRFGSWIWWRFASKIRSDLFASMTGGAPAPMPATADQQRALGELQIIAAGGFRRQIRGQVCARYAAGTCQVDDEPARGISQVHQR